MEMNLLLHVLSDEGLSRGRPHVEVMREAIMGGATVIQLRDKTSSTRRLIEIGRTLRALTRAAGVTFIVNDRADVAFAVDADGVHVGQDDLPATEARRIVGPRKIVGVSASHVAEAIQAERDGADYIGAGTIYATGSKSDAGAPIGVEGLAQIARAVSIPVVAIGGIKASNAMACIAAGAVGVAVISAVVSADDVRQAARELRDNIRRAV
jgi:thiamine-phosphate pyrophosphorylase